MNEENIKAQIAKLQNEAQVLTQKPNFNRADKAAFDLKMSQVADLRSQLKSLQTTDEQRKLRAAEIVNSFTPEEQRAANRAIESTLSREERKVRETESFCDFIRTGKVEHRTYAGLDSLVLANDFVPVEYYRDLVNGIAQVSELMSRENVFLLETENGRQTPVPGFDLTSITSSIVGQNTQNDPTSNPTVYQSVLGAYSFKTSPVGVSIELQSDSFADISSLIGEAFAQGIARGVGGKLVNGNGTTEPQGILTAAANSNVTTAAAGAIGATDISSIFFALNRAYRNSPKCAWLMNDTTYQHVRTATDANGRPLLNISRDGETLMGKKVLISPDMPSAPGSKGIVFGDLSKFCVRIAKNSMFVRRASELPGYVEQGQVLLSCYLRVDSRLITAGAQPAVYATLHS